ncbi:MAG: chloramphenicol acetyltransferase [Deltaproteobacteria bacterium HGW-Deltaproteobacteria-19]|jgi:acetyltransferase-like isoleucine patch superfamily enzyme|nr:MAG: chloramphenicol acetyltransferase [Deltaproteobacteria bacterium HGW-Deltaproteobacteria-19]
MKSLKDIFNRRKDTFYTRDWIREPYAEIGAHTYGKPEVVPFQDAGAHLKIGKFCSIAGSVTIFLGGDHRTDWVTTYPFPVLSAFWPSVSSIPHTSITKGDVVIGNDVWIGFGAMILSGVTIGDGAVIGARAMVASDVEPYTVAVGNPARSVSRRFDDATVARLLRIRWWDWPDEVIAERIPLLCSGDLPSFLDRFDPEGRIAGPARVPEGS